MVRFIGNFPPPYGGVTIKNQLLFDELSKHIHIHKLRKCKMLPNKVYQVLNCLTALLPNQTLIIGISAKSGKSLQQTKLLYALNRANMKRSIYFMMGGREAERIAKDTEQVQMYKNYKKIYVETQSMKDQLVEVGLNNVSLYPNCRMRPQKHFKGESKDARKLRCVFFSLIQAKKGVDNILGAAKELPNVEFAFYGHIDDNYREYFTNATAQLPNVRYMGVFSGDAESVYRELAQYDVALLPTKWKTEGVPGILVEAKVAGITCIVSDECYNAEIIKNGEDGIVLSENTPEGLVQAIDTLDSDRALLRRLQVNNHASAENYYIENYMNQIEKSLCLGGVIQRRIKAVFFSRLSLHKGIDLILGAAQNLSEVEFHLYGEIDCSIGDTERRRLRNLPNVTYHGVFHGTDTQVYEELSKYDVMLLPTRWKNEGVPGVLVEAKIACLPSIVSDICYNSEIIEDGVSGLVLEKNTVDCLTEAIDSLNQHRSKLEMLKLGARQSAEMYYIDHYIDGIVRNLVGKK